MALESNIYALWVANQPSGRGVLATAGTKRVIQVAGDLESQRADGSEAFSDLEQFGNMQDFVNTIVGQGSPGLEAQSDILAYLCFLFFGEDTVSAGLESEQTLPTTVTGGTWGLTVGFGQLMQTTPATLPAAATAAEIAAALNLLAVVKAAGGVTCTGGPISTTPVVVKFINPTLGNFKMVANKGTATLVPVAAMTKEGTYSKHTYVPRLAGGLYTTWWKRIGVTPTLRQEFGDGKMASLTVEGSTSQKIVRITPTVIFLQPGILFSESEENGALGLTGKPVDLINDPFVYTEGAGKYVIDGVTFSGQTQFNITWDYALSPVYGDNVTPYDLQPGQAKVTLATTLILDTIGLEQYSRIIYGESKPAAGKAPVKSLPAMGSYEATLIKESVPGNVTNREEFKVLVPSVKWAPGLSVAINPQGGAIDLPLAGEMRRNLGQPASTVTVLNPDPSKYSA